MAESVRFHAIRIRPAWLLAGLLTLFLLLAALILSLLGRAIPTAGGAVVSSPEVGAPALDFTLPDLGGRRISLSSHKGHPVIVYFWASWCPFCRKEAPALQALYQKHRAEGLVVLAVNIMEDRQTIERFTAEHKLTYPILRDEDGAVTTAWLVRVTPTFHFVDRAGTIRGRILGEPAPGDLDRAVAEILKPLETPAPRR